MVVGAQGGIAVDISVPSPPVARTFPLGSAGMPAKGPEPKDRWNPLDKSLALEHLLGLCGACAIPS
jgi:hypothetical protein